MNCNHWKDFIFILPFYEWFPVLYVGWLVTVQVRVLEFLFREDYCCTCKWYALEEAVCCNADSEHCADFRCLDDSCECWEEIKDEDNGQRN